MTWLAVLLAPLLGVVPFDPPVAEPQGEVPAVRLEQPAPPDAPTIAAPLAGPAGTHCRQHYATALAVGWPADQWRTLSRVMWRESRCNPGAVHRNRNRSVDRGLMQVNSVHLPWLADYGVSAADLSTADGSLTAALLLWERQGWRPWRATR